MDTPSQSATSTSLLALLRRQPTDQEAWREFVRRYGPRIFNWCRGWNLQPVDAEDVTQDVLLKLARKLTDFTYDPDGSFRAWLKTLTHHAWSDFLDGRRRVGTSEGLQSLETIEAREDLIRRLDEEFDRELLEIAMNRVRLRVAPQTWEAFRLTALENLSGAEVATRVGMQVAMVFRARSKVQKMVQEELARLERADSSAVARGATDE